MKKSWPSLLAFVLILLVWHFIVSSGLIPSFLLPAPGQVFHSFSEMPEDFAMAFQSTLKSTLWGFFLSSILGFSLALLFSSSDFLKRAFLPFAVFFQTVPIVAIAPLLVIWFGFGESTVRASALIVSIFPVLANSLVGLSNFDAGLKELLNSYGASHRQILLKLQIPSSLPAVFSGLQVAAGLAVIGALVGEFVAGGGLGGLIDSARTQQRVDIVFAALFLSSVLGLGLTGLVRGAAQMILRWRPFFSKDLF
ncbi:MAG: ABC transporter permease [Pseudobdellovibrionaceae bacterium]